MNKTNYTVLKNDTIGRYLVASRDIKAGEVIISEKPLLIGPPISGLLICFNCCKEIKRIAYVLCASCGTAILCNVKCTGKFHTKEECEIFASKQINGRCIADNCQIIFPLRCLLLKATNIDSWTDFMKLECHLEARRDKPIWRKHKTDVEEILREMNVISEEDINTELTQKICGILDVNTFEVRPPNSSISTINPERQCLRGLYIKAALMTHDCTANTLLSVDDDFTMTVKASVDIPKDGLIYFNYANVLQGSLDRREHLREGKYFECSCKRCLDPTELDTNISSIKCHLCPEGFVKAVKPSDPKSEWKCSGCGKIFLHSLVNIIVDEGKRLIQNLDQNNLEAFETLHTRLLRTFHPNHHLLLEMQQNMIGLYSLFPPNVTNLKKKIVNCQSLIRVLSVIEPGISRMKALTLYQLQSAMIDLSHKNYQEKSINLKCLVLNLTTAEEILSESIRYLLHEPAKSPEGIIARTALNELKMLRMSINNIKNDIVANEMFTNATKFQENSNLDTNATRYVELKQKQVKKNRKKVK
ncbi:SET domain-containing protein SmydA-8-like [Diabrotica undecimpunctata]|uniref:SET domain-containing protein SmydA-8-like n=1 Tax=Diabrotica undecimpunctata TaxID=50387 RepID=UPI003B6329FE